MRIDSSGNCGIGTTNPSEKLTISGSSDGTNATWQGGTNFVRLLAGSGSSWSEQAIAFQEGNNDIGAKIGVKNTLNGAYDIIFANRNNSSTTSTLTERLRITSSGNITASTTSALTVGTIELGHASDTTLARGAAGRLTVEGVNVPTISSTDTLTNKTLTSPVISTISNTGTLTLPVLF